MANTYDIVSPSARLMDSAEKVVGVGLWVWLVIRLWPDNSSPAAWYSLLVPLSEGLVVLLLLIRRPTNRISTNVGDWIIAAAGSLLTLLVSKGGEPLAPAVGGFMMLVGICIHVTAKFSLWRSFGLVAAHRGLRTGGLYRVVRHPMYSGYMMTHAGFLLIAPTLWNITIYLAVWTFLVARIFAEERILGQDPAYQAFKERVRYRLIPGIF